VSWKNVGFFPGLKDEFLGFHGFLDFETLFSKSGTFLGFSGTGRYPELKFSSH